METPRDEYDLFISYAHADDKVDGWVTAFVEVLRTEHARYSSAPLKVFFDKNDIRSMDDWEHRIYRGLRGSTLMLAFLSPGYFASPYCRKECERFVEHEVDRLLHGEAIAPIYFVTAPAFDDKEAVHEWILNLRRRQYFDARPWHPDGVEALRREDVRKRIEKLDQQIADRLVRARKQDASPTTIPPHNPQFVGRTVELTWLREQLSMSRVGVVAAVQGLGGIGKSALAFEYAHAYAAEYPGGRFLVPCAGVEDIRLPLVSMADRFDVQLSDEERRDIGLAYERICAALENRDRSLLLLDNVDRSALLSPAQIMLLPKRDRVHVLVTTRMARVTTEGVETLELETLPEADAVRLLENHRAFGSDAEREAAHGIALRLGGYAIAVEVAAVYLWQHPEISCADYLERLTAEGLGAVEGPGSDPDLHLSCHQEKLLSGMLAPTLASLSPPERLAIEFAALLPPDQIALPWLKALVGERYPKIVKEIPAGFPDPWLQIERRLRGLRLLLLSEEPRVARMHRLVGEVVQRARPDALGLKEALIAHAKTRGSFLFNGGWVEHANRWEIAPLRSLAWHEMDAGSSDGADLANSVQGPEMAFGNLEGAHALLRSAIAIEEKAFAPDHPTLATSYSNLATVKIDLGSLDEARSLLRRAIAIEEKVFAADHPKLAIRYSNLAVVEQDLGNLEEAQTLLRRAVLIQEKALAPDHPKLAIRYSNLAMVEQDLGNLEEARTLLHRAIAIEEKAYAPDHPKLAVRYSNLATVELDLGNLEEARALMCRAIVIEEKAFAPDHPNLAVRYSNLATVEQHLGNLDEARALMRRAIAIEEMAFAPDHPKLAICYSIMALVEQDLGNLDEARALLRRAIVIKEKAFAPDHPTLATSYSNLAMVEKDLGNLDEARALLRRAIVINRKAFAPDHPTLATSYSNLAGVEWDRGSLEEARRLLQMAYKILSTRLGAGHPKTKTVEGWLRSIGDIP